MLRSMEISSLRGPWSADPGGTTLSSWIANARYGTCGLTEVRVDGGCKAGATKGVWQPRLQQSTPVAMVAWCLRQCASCQGCKHVTVSHILSECSWFATCDYDNPVAIPKGVSTEMFLSGPAVDSPRLRNDLTSHGKDDHETPDRPDLAGAPASPTDHGDLAELTQHQQPAEMLKFNLPVDRFAPGTFEQAMASVYTMWNLLDRMVLQINNTEPWTFGMFLPVQVERLVRAVRRPGVKHYCEVGFNGGHSSAAVLASTASVSVRSFDFGLYGRHTARNAAWLREMHPGRFRYVQGDSALTLPFLSAAVRSGHEPPCDVSSQCCTLGRMPWLSLAPAQRLHRCLLSAQAKASPLALHTQVILVDGSHEDLPTYSDLRYFREAAAPGAIVFLDDLDSRGGIAVHRAYTRGWLTTLAWYIYQKKARGKSMECANCTRDLPNLQRITDSAFELAPCMRWLRPGCQRQVVETGTWNTQHCSTCHDGAAWGIGQFVGRPNA